MYWPLALPRRLPALLVTFIASAWLPVSSASADANERVHVREKVVVDARGSDFPLITSTVTVTAPASNNYVRDILAEPPDSPLYREAFRKLINAFEAFTPDVYALAEPLASDVPYVRPEVSGGRAKISLTTWSRVSGAESNTGFGHWRVDVDGNELTLRLSPGSPLLPATLDVTMDLHGVHYLGSDPPPTHRTAQTPLRWVMPLEQPQSISVELEAGGWALHHLNANRSPWVYLYPSPTC